MNIYTFNKEYCHFDSVNVISVLAINEEDAWKFAEAAHLDGDYPEFVPGEWSLGSIEPVRSGIVIQFMHNG